MQKHFRTWHNLVFTFVLLISSMAFDLKAQNFSGGFNFRLPGNDTTSRKFLPQFPAKPITDNDFLSINSDGNFSINGKPVRFWGANLVSAGAFPDKQKAWYVAGRLRKMGFNLIRLHHMDNNWSDSDGGSLFANMSDTRHFNSSSLDRLEFLISELKKNGIYANVNLNVSRTFRKSDGVPDADSLLDFAKGVTIFDPQLISLEKEYARMLLTHQNPYTGLKLTDDPVMGIVEIINENSLYRMWRDNKLKHFSEGGSLTLRHAKMLDTLWNKFLLNKYKTTQALSDSWNAGTYSSAFKNLIINGDFESSSISTNWYMELHNGASAVMAKDLLNPYNGTASAKITVTNITGTDWHIQWKQTGFSVKKDSLYTVEFAAMADSARTISVTVMRDNDPYTVYTAKSFNLTTQWKVFTLAFKAPETNNGYGRLSFSFNNSKGRFWFDDIKLGSGGTKGLLETESLDNLTVKRTDYGNSYSYSDARIKDMSEFYISLQDNFFADMKNYLRNTLGVKVPILATNWNIGPGDLISQSKLDYLDNHSYWQHPNFPNVPWSSTDWNIPNTSMVKDIYGGTMGGLFGGNAMVGKPYTVSEYNHPFPNRYQTEMALFTAAYLSFHNADGVEFFEYNSMNDFETDFVPGFFSIARNPAIMALMPSCASAFRNNFISKANETIKINYSANSVYMLPKNDKGDWWGVTLYPQKLALIHSVRNASFSADTITDFSKLPPEPVSPYRTDTDEIIWDTQGLLTVGTPKFSGIAGFLDQFEGKTAGNMTLKKANDFGTVTWISLTGDSLKNSSSSLITVSSKVQNNGMIWDGITTVHNNWGSSPTEIFPLNLTLSLNVNADSIKVYPLDQYGRTSAPPAVYFPLSPSVFEIQIDQNDSKTLWYGVESFIKLSTGIQEKTSGITSFKLEQNYPNPFNNSTIIKYSVPYESHIKIDIFDALGKRVQSLFDQNQPKGYYSVSWKGKNNNNEDVKSGIYFVQLKSDNFVETKKILLLK